MAHGKARGTAAVLVIALANEAPIGKYAMAGFTNAAEIGADGWTIIPYGEWPHSQGIQQFAREQADAIVDNFKSGWARFKRAVIVEHVGTL